MKKHTTQDCEIASLSASAVEAFGMINDYKMYHDVHRTFVPLNELVDWKVTNEEVTCRKKADFCVRYYNIEIQGREVQNWIQPLFKATSSALFVLFTKVENGVRKFLITLVPEIGCFDKVEFGPSIQLSDFSKLCHRNMLHNIYLNHIQSRKGVLADVLLSEEGGRFYHEQNRNVIIEINPDEITQCKDALWVDSKTLSLLMLNNNILNIQLRNLMSLFDPMEVEC